MQQLVQPVETASLLKCIGCNQPSMNFDSNKEAYTCPQCDMIYPTKSGVIHGLQDMSQDTQNELNGMMRESGHSESNLENFVIRDVAKVDTFNERKSTSKDLIFDYYGSCLMHFNQALNYISIQGDEKVVEVGSELDFPFLQHFSKKGCRCFATNIYFTRDEELKKNEVAQPVLGDMNRLPYADESFDIVIFSATLHHSNQLNLVASEIFRILKPGGKFISINEPVAGILKNLSKREDCPEPNRHEEINENEYTIFQYLGAFKKFGMEAKTFFPEYYDQRLKSGALQGQRFNSLAKLTSLIWQIPPVRAILKSIGLPLGQILIGLQFNAVFTKPSE